MPLNVPLLKSSFDLVVEREPIITVRFYEHLFENHPEVKPMFSRNKPEAQQKMLQGALVAVLDRIEDGEWLADTLGALGRKHVGYGVRDEMYDWVGHALLQTLAEIAGDDWNDDLHGAWADAFGAIRDLMLAGAKTAAA